MLIDTSKKEMLNPNAGYKKIVQKLKTRYQVGIDSLQVAHCFSKHFKLLTALSLV